MAAQSSIKIVEEYWCKSDVSLRVKGSMLGHSVGLAIEALMREPLWYDHCRLLQFYEKLEQSSFKKGSSS